MAILRNLVVQITGDTSGLQKSLGAAQQKLGSSLGAMNKVGAAFSGTFSGMLGPISNLVTGATGLGAALGPAGIALGVVTGGIALMAGAANKAVDALKEITSKVIVFSSECIELGSNLTEIQNVVDVTFGPAAKQVDAFAASAFSGFGLSEMSAKQFSGTMGAMLKSMGLSNASALSMSTSMAKLAGDFASFYNLKPEEAFEKIRAGISGETEPLRQLGINMSVANLEAYALSQGIKTSYQKLDQASQAILRYNYLMAVSADAQGDFARTSGSWANQTRMLTLQFDSFKAAIGQGLIAALTPLIQVINVVTAKLVMLGNIFRYIMQTIFGAQPAMGGAAAAAAGMAESSGAAADGMDGLAKSIKGAGGAAKKVLAPFDELNVLMMGGGGGGGSIGGMNLEPPKPPDTTDLDSWLDDLKNRFNFQPLIDAWDRFKTSLKPLTEKLGEGWDWFVKNILEPLGKWLIEKALPAALDDLAAGADVLSAAFDALEPYAKKLWENFLKPAAEWTGDKIIQGLKDLNVKLGELKTWIEKNPDAFAQMVSTFGVKAVQAFTNAALSASGFGGVVDLLKHKFDAAQAGAGALSKMWDSMKASNDTFMKNFAAGWDKLASKNDDTIADFKAGWSVMSGWFQSNVINPTKTQFSNFAAGLKIIAETAWANTTKPFTAAATFFTAIWNTIKAKFIAIGGSFGDAVSNAFKAGINNLFALLERKLNSFVDSFNSILSIVNQIPGVNIGRIGHIDIPRLASGGVAQRSTLAEIGEAGREAVLPLDRNTSWMDDLAAKIGGQLAMAGGPGGVLYADISIGGEKIGRQVVKLRRWDNIRSNGRGL